MKRVLLIIGISITAIFFCFILTMHIWIGHGIRERINIAKMQYSGIAEDALIAYLLDTKHSPSDRSDVAIWTLGQIQSKKALPILYGFYKNDPEGKTCRGHHNSVLCQYEIYKAIKCIEHDYWWVSRPGLNK
jgi:hypothetical protein